MSWRQAWVLRVTTNLALDHVRRQRRRWRSMPTAQAEPDATDRPALVAALGRLPARQRQAVVLRYIGGLSDIEVASALGCATGTVKSHLHRGLEGLRHHMGADLALDPEVSDGTA